MPKPAKKSARERLLAHYDAAARRSMWPQQWRNKTRRLLRSALVEAADAACEALRKSYPMREVQEFAVRAAILRPRKRAGR